jgi:hypothetical protein
MRCEVLVLAGIFSFVSSGFSGSAPSEWDRYCRKCHVDSPVNALYDSSAKAHKNAFISCVACHTDKGIAGHVKESAASFLLFFQGVTLPPDIRPRKSPSITSDDCLGCHPYVLEVDEISPRKIPKDVRLIKLRAAHGQHWDYRNFGPDQQERLKTLINQKAINKTEFDQISRLSQIEKMQCSHCHERFRRDIPGGVDLNVNIAMKNPMECTACHVEIVKAIHPGDNSPLPSAVSCERCHYGKLHQKMVFFPVDHGSKTDCLRCHPEYKPDKHVGVEPEQFIHKSTALLNPSKGVNR